MRTHLKTTVSKDGTMTTTQYIPETPAAIWKTCRACSEGPLDPILSLGDQYLVNFVKEVDFGLPRVPLNLMRCHSCGLLQLEHSANVELFRREYWYRSSVNETMRTALSDVVRSGLQYHHDGVWLDIGANDGYLLSQVPPGFTKIACEPAKEFEETLSDIADEVISAPFSAQHECLFGPSGENFKARGRCDVITSAAMFYDLDNPSAFIADIAKTLSPNGVWINQLNDSPTMLKTNAFDSICHEHVTYYDVHTLNSLYERNGLVIIGITYNEVNGGSIRIVAERPVSMSSRIVLEEHRRVSEMDATHFAKRAVKWKKNMTDLITGTLAHDSRMWLYGASTKGCALLQYLDINEAFVGIADRNPIKYGLKMAGTWLPVESEDRMRADNPRHIMVLPWAFRDEFVQRESDILKAGATMIFPLPNIEFVV